MGIEFKDYYYGQEWTTASCVIDDHITYCKVGSFGRQSVTLTKKEYIEKLLNELVSEKDLEKMDILKKDIVNCIERL